MSLDYTTPLGAARLKEQIDSKFRILSGQREKVFTGLYNMRENVKAKRSAQLNFGSLEMSRQTDAKGKVNQTHTAANKTFLEQHDYDAEVCFSYDEIHSLEADPIAPTVKRLKEASDKTCDLAALEAIFGDIVMGDPCKLKLYKDLCHVEHDGVGFTPEKVTAAVEAIAAWHPGSEVCIGVTNESQFNMTRFPEWTNNDLLFSGVNSAYSGMVQRWNRASFKLMPDFREMRDMEGNPFGLLKPIIPAVPCIENGLWDGISFIRFLPVWVKDGLDMAHGHGPTVTPMPDIWKARGLAMGTYFIRIDERHGFAMNDERARAVICVKEQSKALAESYVKSGGAGFGAPDGIMA